jgi:hypothetical protein
MENWYDIDENTNAKIEFLQAVLDKAKVKCAEITFNKEPFLLKISHTQEEYDEFLESLDFMYDSGFGGQYVFGTIWLEDGTWFTRAEYDGSEWWWYHSLPDIPKKLFKMFK